MAKVYFSFGSNIGNRVRNIEKALQLLEECGLEFKKASSLYESDAMSNVKQGKFLNMCAEYETHWTPQKLLSIIQMIEKQIGRVKLKPKKYMYWEPRIIDIDILFYDKIKLNTPRLKIPHPHIKEREFITIPLQELGLKM